MSAGPFSVQISGEVATYDYMHIGFINYLMEDGFGLTWRWFHISSQVSHNHPAPSPDSAGSSIRSSSTSPRGPMNTLCLTQGGVAAPSSACLSSPAFASVSGDLGGGGSAGAVTSSSGMGAGAFSVATCSELGSGATTVFSGSIVSSLSASPVLEKKIGYFTT